MNLLTKMPLAALLLAGVFGQFAPAAKAQTNNPTVLIHSGTHFIWYTKQSIWKAHQEDISALFDYMDREFEQIVKDWGITPPQDQFYLWVDPHTGGGFATGDIGDIREMTGKEAPGIGVSYDAYSNMGGPRNSVKGYWAYAIGTHETMNLLTGQALSAGWPRDWWADDKSPFPAMTAVTVEAEVGKSDISAAHNASFRGDKLYAMFKAIQGRYGWSIFHKMFALVKADGIQWTSIDSGYNPSSTLTAYVTAYLVLGSGDSLNEWNTNFFRGVIPGYNQELTAKVLAARENWKQHGGDGKAFLSGRYLSVGGFPDFSLSVPMPDTLTVAPGGNVLATFTVSNLEGFSGKVDLSASRLPSGVSAAFTPLGSGKFQMTLSAGQDAPAGASTIAVTGASSGVPLSAGHRITLPVIVSADTAQTAVNLAPVATLYGVGNDHFVTGDNGAIDGAGFAYSGVLLDSGLSWSNTWFAIGIPANGEQGTQNAVTGVTIPLPAGNYSSLKMLGSANGGAKRNETFVVTYTDGSRATFKQSLSDWTEPREVPGQSIVRTMPYSDINLGTFDADRTLYGYSFPLDSSKTVRSFTMPGRSSQPGHSGVVAIAFTLSGPAKPQPEAAGGAGETTHAKE